MSDTAEIIRRLQEPFPREAIKTRAGGGNTLLSYVEAHSVIRRLNAATGGQWDFAVLREEREGDLLKATCRLTIPGLGSREHVGVQKVSERGGEDLHKGAISDALKKAATLFGVGLELYGPDYEHDEDVSPDEPAPIPDALAVVNNIRATPEARKAALHRFYSAAATIAELNERADRAYQSAIDTAVLKAAYSHHHNRLAQLLAPTGIAD